MSNLIVVISILVAPMVVAWAFKKLWISTLITALGLSVITHVAAWLGAGYIDPYYPISIPISLVVFALWSLGVGWLVHRARAIKAAEREKAIAVSRGENHRMKSNRNP